MSGACFAEFGHNVTCLDLDQNKIDALKNGEIPIYEPGLKEIVLRNIEAGRLTFTTSYEEAMPNSDFVFICVGTPMDIDGKADLRYVHAAATDISKNMPTQRGIIIGH